MPRIIVVGGGAAGLMAAGQAAEAGADTWLLEKKERLGRKLRITGKGRCNLTNIAPLDEFLIHYGKNGKFLRQAFSRFFSDELAVFLGGIGVDIQSERGGRVFPANEDAVALTEAMIRWVRNSGVVVKTNTSVSKLFYKDQQVTGLISSEQEFQADAVIVATGGASYPATGSTGDGYRLAESVGHTVVPIRPALVPLITAGDIARRLQGLSLRNVISEVSINGKKKSRLLGEMLFTHYGLSGPIILNQSGMVVDALRQKNEVTISIDLKPALDEKKLDARLLRDFSEQSKKKFKTILKGLLPQKLIPICAELTGIDPDKPGHQITSAERKRLRVWLSEFKFVVTGHRPLAEAIITAGGVELKEIDPRRMASRMKAGLYFAGELLDLNGDTGGYNLQAAFSTGWLAGRSAVADLLRG